MENKHFDKTPYRLRAKPTCARTREESPSIGADRKPTRWRTAQEIWDETQGGKDRLGTRKERS